MWLATKTGDPRQDCAPIRHCATRGCVNEAEERRESGNCRYCGRCFEIITNISRFKKVNVRSGEKMDGSRKNDDCYFYYYSTCSKGDSCLFRHEENALGCEIVCQYWKEGKCMNGRCNYRHMELKKNRKAIPCYWETQPSGCRKPHCPFLHLNEKEKPPDNKSKDSVPVVGAMANIPGGVMKGMPLDGSHPSDGNLRRVAGNPPGGELTYSSPPVDPLVVKFEEVRFRDTYRTSYGPAHCFVEQGGNIFSRETFARYRSPEIFTRDRSPEIFTRDRSPEIFTRDRSLISHSRSRERDYSATRDYDRSRPDFGDRYNRDTDRERFWRDDRTDRTLREEMCTKYILDKFNEDIPRSRIRDNRDNYRRNHGRVTRSRERVRRSASQDRHKSVDRDCHRRDIHVSQRRWNRNRSGVVRSRSPLRRNVSRSPPHDTESDNPFFSHQNRESSPAYTAGDTVQHLENLRKWLW